MSPLVHARRGLVALTVVAVVALLLTAAGRPLSWSAPSWPLPGTTAGLRAVLLCYVCVLGSLVAWYAATNLRGQRRQGRFALLLVAAVGGLAVMVTATSLLTAAAGWTASGLALAGLVAHRDDAAARRASALVLRRLLLGDAAVWAAVAADAAGAGTPVVAVLLVTGCVVRSALVPAHRWLPETAEAPSPVSALLHAGIVNGGPMLCLLWWPVVSQGVALGVLAVAGLASVAAGLAAMRLRSDVKGRLAASTTAQMGLVALQLGLALPAAALVHVLGHGCWKAWLFLRAGGAAGRARPATARPNRRSAAVLVLAAGLVTAGAGLAVGAALGVPGGLALPAGLIAALAAVGVSEALLLERARPGQRAVLAGGAVTLAVGYLLVVGLVDLGLLPWFEDGAEPAGVLVAGSAAVVVTVLALLASRLHPQSSGVVATTMSATLLPPGARASGSVRTTPAPSGGGDLGGLPVQQVGLVADLSALAIGPSWPLTSLVASNPLAPLEKMSVEDAAGVVRRVHGRDPRPRLATFLDLYARGVITDADLRRALGERSPERGGADPLAGVAPEDLVTGTRRLAARDVDGAPLRVRACDAVGPLAARRLDLQVAAWTARAWATTPGLGRHGTDPWTLWRTSAAHRCYDRAWGVRGASGLVRSLPEDPARALGALWPRVQELTGAQDFYTYAASQLATGRGWTAHARWRAREEGDPAPLVQLLALRTALDVVVAEAHGPAAPSPAAAATAAVDTASAPALVSVWQRALDLGARRGLVHGLAGSAGTAAQHRDPAPTRVQSVWCLDARSERVRRAVEAHPGHVTFGYAGFFGAALRHRAADGTSADLCPGLLRPALETADAAVPLTWPAAVHTLVSRVGQRPAAAFGWAETSGIPALAATLAATAAPARWRRLTHRVVGSPTQVPAPAAPLPLPAAIEVAEQLVRTTGLAGRTAPWVVLVGHASSTENNAFASAYDCGACGGHSGARNAALVAAALNDPLVRQALAERGLPVDDGTTFVAALHDTTTDDVTVLDPSGATSSPALVEVQAELREAGRAAAAERRALLPGGRSGVEDRAADWSEPMPEWGLAGNLALVIGPRSLTRSLDLGGTAFLHSYDADLDPDHTALEQVLTGPALVTQWINAQYYAAASAPELLGAGDKTTHNVVGDVGVITGAHGDLRSGLPWQAVAGTDPTADPGDTGALRHLPARHLVVVAADPAAVAEIVLRHTALHQAVGNGWLQLLALPPGSAQLLELDRHLEWRPAGPVPAPRPALEDPPAHV